MTPHRQHPFKVDISAFNKLFAEHYPALRAYAAFLTENTTAEDIVQEVFLNAWENRNTISIHTSAKAYLFKAVYNRSLNHHRNGKNKHPLTEADLLRSDPDKNHVIQQLYVNEIRAVLEEAISSLPDKCREVFKLSYLDTMKNKEISEQLGISVSTVEKHINHALKALRKNLQHIRLLAALLH
ncbi:RNA polymerase sigma-70 factor [Chitinophaga alhagiae]|uniref:RNA polymerase sigma-70 factor n=1 Tax=Chitinophaga alhagiae TaxID=2203219 RepID=A0ABN5LRK8_9BACT|nr:RNA polymerase sigma-70 factor [Chitinophaga alhagiae]AWO00370.1 RNA polymerase sigma-70 factor [Chitinophaga alhagiae]